MNLPYILYKIFSILAPLFYLSTGAIFAAFPVQSPKLRLRLCPSTQAYQRP